MAIAPARRCEFCGYDLRGITSVECPECGQAKTISLRFDDHEHYHLARAALEHADLLVSFVNAGLAGEIVYASTKSAGWLRVSSTNYDRAVDVLNDIGVRWIEEQRVFIDRLEPICPRCNADLTGVSAEVCINCGVRLQWIDAPSTLNADDEIVCPRCFRDVKLVDGRCPECDAAVAEIDADTTDDLTRSIESVQSDRQWVVLWLLLTMALLVPVIVSMAVVFRLLTGSTSFNVVYAATVAAMIAYIIAVRRR